MPNRKDRRAQRSQERKARRTDTMGASYSTGGQIPEHIRNSPQFKRAAKEGMPPEYFALIETMARLIFEWVQAEPARPDLKWHQTDANRTIITGDLDVGAAYLANSPDAFRLLAWLDEKTERKASIYQVTWALRLCRGMPMPDGSYYGVKTTHESDAMKAMQTFVRDFGKAETAVPPSPCGHCGKLLEAATGTESGQKAEPGNLSICVKCLGINRFDENLAMVAMTDEDMAAVPAPVRAQLDEMAALLRSSRYRSASAGKARVEA